MHSIKVLADAWCLEKIIWHLDEAIALARDSCLVPWHGEPRPQAQLFKVGVQVGSLVACANFFLYSPGTKMPPESQVELEILQCTLLDYTVLYITALNSRPFTQSLFAWFTFPTQFYYSTVSLIKVYTHTKVLQLLTGSSSPSIIIRTMNACVLCYQ